MKLDLNVNSYDSETQIDTPSIADLKDWLESATDPSLNALIDHIRALHSMSCSDVRRFELLDMFRPMITRAGVRLRERLQDSQLPLPEDLVNGLDELARVHSVVADVYKRGLLSQQDVLLKSAHSSDQDYITALRRLVLACYGAINHLAEQLRSVYETYQSPPKGVWREVHHIYQFAHSIISKSAVDTIDGRTGMDEFFMIEHVYKRSLLLGLCNPFHFSFRQFKDLNRTLNSRASLCSIHFETNVAELHNLFSIDFNSDYPAAPVLRSGDLLQGEHYAVLDTRDLVSSLNREIDGISSEVFSATSEHSRAEDLLTLEMLRRLRMNWGQHPMRRDQRSEEKGGQCYIATGFDRIVARVSRDGVLLDKMASSSNAATGLSCEIADSSPMGYQLSFMPDSKVQFQIGEMIALHSDADPEAWSLGIVRWARYLSSTHVGVGIFILGTGCRRIRVRGLSGTQGESADCLRLTESQSLPMNRKLIIAPSILYQPGVQLEMMDRQREEIRAGNMLLSGADFVVFEYQ